MTFYEVSIDETKTILILCEIRFSYSDVTQDLKKNQHIAVFVIERINSSIVIVDLIHKQVTCNFK